MLRDVFVSYSHRDIEWVNKTLVPHLEARDFSVLIDKRDFRSGAIGVDEMQRAVEECRHTLVVLTPNYVKSDWGALESAMAQTLDPNAKWRTVIPILREDCDIPLRLRILQYRDMRNDDPAEWERLYRDLA